MSIPKWRVLLLLCATLPFSACSTMNSTNISQRYSSYEIPTRASGMSVDYANRIPQHIATGEKTVVVDPRVHVWGAYGSDGSLIRAGIASAGSNWCGDLGHPCHTRVGSFRVYSMGGPGCKSHIFPIPRGGAPMPYCMFFHGGQALHGVPPFEVGEGNFSHGCVRLQVGDAEWLRYNFVNIGTKVIVRPY